MLTVVDNEVMFDVALRFPVNFDHTIKKLKRSGAVLSSAELQRKKINLNSQGEVYVLLHDI